METPIKCPWCNNFIADSYAGIEDSDNNLLSIEPFILQCGVCSKIAKYLPSSEVIKLDLTKVEELEELDGQTPTLKGCKLCKHYLNLIDESYCDVYNKEAKNNGKDCKQFEIFPPLNELVNYLFEVLAIDLSCMDFSALDLMDYRPLWEHFGVDAKRIQEEANKR